MQTLGNTRSDNESEYNFGGARISHTASRYAEIDFHARPRQRKRTFSLGGRTRCRNATPQMQTHIQPLCPDPSPLYVHAYITMHFRALSSKKRIRSGRSSVECAAQRIHRICNSDSHHTSRANEPYAHAYVFAAHAICSASNDASCQVGISQDATVPKTTLAKINVCRGTIRRTYAIRKPIGRETKEESEREKDQGGVLTRGCCLPCSNVDRTPSIVLAPYPAFKRISRSPRPAFICAVGQLNASFPRINKKYFVEINLAFFLYKRYANR